MELIRADSPKITARAVLALHKRLVEDEGCAFCNAQALLNEFRELVTQLAQRGHLPPLRFVREFAEPLHMILDAAPTPNPSCRACRSARRRARWGRDGPCPVHAQCPACWGEESR